MKNFILLSIITTLFLGCSTQSTPGIFETRTTVTSAVEMNYFLYTPKEALSEKVPLLLFLHGGGESGDNPEAIKTHGPAKLIAAGKDFPFYVLAPQNPYKRGFWDDQAVYNLLQEIISTNNVDPKRIYLSGMSRGGYGAWRLAMNYPDTFAAMALVCAASVPKAYAKRVKHMPIKLFHGLKDKVIPASETIDMYKELTKLKADVSLKLYPEATHDSWTETYEQDSLYKWFLSKQLK
ncbi:MAG: prolyl oligopeptidase family serine peptidase [Lentisphaeraceae bacterium]|nr:prolyl oligopeptidase family serine peptidase [Lentisphaeraceae bacterium]